MGIPVNPLDVVRVERVRGRGPLRIQALHDKAFIYKVSRITKIDADGDPVSDTETMNMKQVRPIFEQVARAQEPTANEARHRELVNRIIDRSWNAPVLYLNTSTGSVET